MDTINIYTDRYRYIIKKLQKNPSRSYWNKKERDELSQYMLETVEQAIPEATDNTLVVDADRFAGLAQDMRNSSIIAPSQYANEISGCVILKK